MKDSLKIHTGARNVRFREQESVRIPSPACGLTTAEAERSRKRYGVVRQFFRNLNNPIIRILIAALSNGSCRVIRDSEDGEIPVSELVRYDLVILRPGDTVPADGILLRGEICCDESPLTGESRPVRKACSAADSEQFRRDPDGYSLNTGDSAAVFCGSHVTEGSALMLGTAVGDSTLYGAIVSELSAAVVRMKAADVGFAMGSGTDAAREAGDIVITDNNFVSITQAILFGRTIFESIRKFITFQLTMNLAAVGITVIGTMFGIENPVTVIQMLWVNMVMDTLGSLAFAGEPALKHAMRRKPVRRDEPILNRAMVGQIALTGGYAVLLSVYFLLSPSIRHLFGGGETAHLTRFFALFIFMGIGIAHCTRTSRINLFAGLSRNRAFLVIMPAVALVQLLIVYFGGEIFRCVPLAPQELGLCALFAFTVVPADTIRKCVASLWRERELERKDLRGSSL